MSQIRIRREYTEKDVATQRLAVMVLLQAKKEASGDVAGPLPKKLSPERGRKEMKRQARHWITTDSESLRNTLLLAGVEEEDIALAIERLKKLYGGNGNDRAKKSSV